ncbi:SNAP receptor use1 [Dermatophagoides pteronyssinus]|uniref:Vesicle transport protein USE1 n=1 Tax=Dermatophagoides pteronyssinus TaxID=6956 RepID=A0ABQ8J267_DERPT|nr:SNAP receptor use1 [Dermatophagoides pteronyssinus]
MTIIHRSKNHINIMNLLSKCEYRFQQINDKSDWRLEQYIKSIFQMLEQEEMNTGKLNDELVAAKKKAQFFQGLLDAHAKDTTILEQYSIINSLQSNSTTAIQQQQQQMENETKRIHLTEIAKCDKRMKKELLSSRLTTDNKTTTADDKNENHENRIRNTKNKNYEDIIKYHELLQEKVTNEMVILVQNLKQNLTTSNEIVKKDTELLEKTNQFTEKNVSNLRKNADKIREFASAACEYWLWISLTLVIFIFLFMVIFIRLFPKKATIIVINNIAGQQQQPYYQSLQPSSDQINAYTNDINDGNQRIEL